MKFSRITNLSMLLMVLFVLTGSTGCASSEHRTDRDPVGVLNASDTPVAGLIMKSGQMKTGLENLPAVDAPPAGAPLDLSIEQAVLLALGNNRELAVEQMGPVIAGTFEDIERANFDPEIFGEAQYAKEKAEETARSTGTRFNVASRETEMVVGIRQKMPTGTTLETTISQERSVSNRTPEQQVARVGVGITQALLRGFGPAVNLAGIRQAQLDALASHYQLRGFIEALLAETETTYWHYVLARKEIFIFEQSLAIAEKQRDEAEKRIAVGMLPEIEAAAARAEVALREQALIDARSRYVDARLRLLRLINPPGGPFERKVNATSELTVSPQGIADLSDRLKLALMNRADLGEARLRLEQNRLETVVSRNGLLPRLDFFIALGTTGYADSFSGTFRELDSGTYDFTAGIRLNHFLGTRAEKARNLTARVSMRRAALALSNLEQLVSLDVRLAVNEVERARQQITASAATRVLQEETLRAERERFAVGAGTALLVAQAQRDLVAGQIAEVEAMVTYRIARIHLYLAEGSLLERRGVCVSAEDTSLASQIIRTKRGGTCNLLPHAP